MRIIAALAETASAVPEIVDFARGILNATQDAVSGIAGQTEAIQKIASNIPAIISNNYSLIIGIIIAYFAYSILKSGVKIVLMILAIGIAATVLTNMGIMPDLNNIIDSIRGVAQA